MGGGTAPVTPSPRRGARVISGPGGAGHEGEHLHLPPEPILRAEGLCASDPAARDLRARISRPRRDQEVGRWPRTTQKGQRFLEPAHYAGRFQGEKASALEHQFRTLCDAAPTYLEGLATARGASLREQMRQIVGLAETYSRTELHAAMTRALAFKRFGYGSLHRILQTQQAAPEALPRRAGGRGTAAARAPGGGGGTTGPGLLRATAGGTAPWMSSSMA